MLNSLSTDSIIRIKYEVFNILPQLICEGQIVSKQDEKHKP